jgi:hypothetical protein
MSAGELATLLAFLLPVAALLVVLALIAYLAWSRGRGYHGSLTRVRAALIRLQYKPDDPGAITNLLAAIENGDWLRSGDLTVQRELWTRSMDLGFSLIPGDSGHQVLHQVVLPLCATQVCHPPDLIRQIHAVANRRPESREALGAATGFVRLLPPLVHNVDRWLSEFMSAIHSLLSAHPAQREVHGMLAHFVQLLPRVSQTQTGWFYQRALDLVKESPQVAEVVTLALEVGRWHCRSSRPDGKVTLYDEQMLRNDIAVRTGA